jgi:CO/xanthine dehydrogenase FAD-binding subunit
MRAYLPDCELRVANHLDQALGLLANGEGWQPIAGGTDLMVLLNAGKLFCHRLVSIKNIPELRTITVTDDVVSIGAAVTYRPIREHPVLREEFPLLCQAASWTGGIANQNQGTLGGNIVNASPAADSAPPLLVHDARLRLISSMGERVVPYVEFHLGYKKLEMRSDELLYKIELPRRPEIWEYRGRKVGTRQAQAISKCSIALAVRGSSGTIADVRIAFGSVAPIPKRCLKTEDALRGRSPNAEAIGNACAVLRTEIAPIDDIRSTAVYRSRVAENLFRHFLMHGNDIG